MRRDWDLSQGSPEAAMSTDFTVRPVGAPATTPVVQRLSEAANNAVTTELPGSQSVTVVDNRTNLVVQQFPDEAVLRRRAYLRALDLTKDALTHHVVTDRKI
jgi:hypothetical protein